jgi:hypothetical protein
MGEPFLMFGERKRRRGRGRRGGGDRERGRKREREKERESERERETNDDKRDEEEGSDRCKWAINQSLGSIWKLGKALSHSVSGKKYSNVDILPLNQ